MTALLQHEAIRAALSDAGHDAVALSLFSDLPSTSQWLKEQLFERPELRSKAPWLCAVDWQTNGSGRRGKHWDSEPGNITFTLMTRVASTPSALMGLSLVTGVAVAETLQSCCNLQVQLKWPNDILFRGAKLGGLLTEVLSTPEKDAQCMVFSGVGLNLLHHPSQATLGIGATSLEANGIQIDRDHLLGRLAASVLSAHQQFIQDGWLAFAARWARHDFLYGRDITIHRTDQVEHARACGVNEDGALLVTTSGKTFPVYSGEVSVRPV